MRGWTLGSDMNRVFNSWGSTSKAFRRQLRWLCALLFGGAKSRQKLLPPVSVPCFAGFPAVLTSGGAKRTRFAQTPFRFFRLTLRSSAPSRLLNVKGKVNFKSKPHRAQARSISGITRIMGGGLPAMLFHPDWQESLAFEPRKATEGTDRIGKHERRRQANSTSIQLKLLKQRGFKRDFLGTFLSQDTKKYLASACVASGETPLTLLVANHNRTSRL